MADENSTANTARRAAGKLHSISNNVGGSTELKPPLPQRAVTTRYEFDATPYNGKLFSVNAGIPLSDAFDQLTMLLEASQLAIADIGFAVDSGEKPQSQWGAAYLANCASALVQAMHSGLIAHEAEILVAASPTAL